MKKINTTTFITAVVAGLMANATLLAEGYGSEQGQYECQGGNSCKGTGACGGKGHGCHGKNTCDGKGFTMTQDKAECDAVLAKKKQTKGKENK